MICQHRPKTKSASQTSRPRIIMLPKKCLWTFVPTVSLKYRIDYPGTLTHPDFMDFTDISAQIITWSLGSSPISNSSNSLSHFVDYCTSSLIKSRVNHDYCAVKHLGRHDMKSTKKMQLNLITLYLLKPIYMLKTPFYYIQYYISYKLQSQSNFPVPFLIINIIACN